jgi:hypothetical protein
MQFPEYTPFILKCCVVYIALFNFQRLLTCSSYSYFSKSVTAGVARNNIEGSII